jgi:hypothetical protein
MKLFTDLFKMYDALHKMYSQTQCLFPVVEKSGTSCYHLVTRLMRPTDSQQVVPTSLISSACNKLFNKLITIDDKLA